MKWSGIWVRLGIGFALLLALICVSTVSALRETFRNRQQLSDAYLRHDRIAEALMRIRSDLYLAGILKRDFLLDPAPSHAPEYGDQFAKIKASTDQYLHTLETLLTPGEATSLSRLRAEVESYMQPLEYAADWEPIASGTIQWELLRLQLRQRSTALQMAADIEKLNARDLSLQRDKVRISEEQFRRFLSITAFSSLFLGVLIAGLTVWHMRRLERISEEAKSELRELSHQVVKVQEQERKTISRELHDEVGQMLTGLRMELGNLDGPHAQKDPAFYQRLLETKRIAEHSLRTVRNMAMLLRPSMLDDLGLSPALRWQAREFTQHSEVPVELSIEGDVDTVSDDLRTCIYRVVQEALTNAARHARARHIRVSIERHAQTVTAVIEDDGVGFDRYKTGKRGLGLLGMEERVRELNGTFDIKSHPGSGTRILIHLPVPERVNELSSVNSG
ncbi:MAG TPA: sensor histidine kinase [Bryobacteraceae bacterium]|nr:sensor histidine kinase [Bryobacteraceae bacterium]